MDNAPRPDELWKQADREHPGDRPGRMNRYLELMIQHGHVIDGGPNGAVAPTPADRQPWEICHRCQVGDHDGCVVPETSEECCCGA